MDIKLNLNDKVVVSQEKYDNLCKCSYELEELKKEHARCHSSICNYVYNHNDYNLQYYVETNKDYYKTRLIEIFTEFRIFTDSEIDIIIQTLISRYKREHPQEDANEVGN